VQLYWHNKDSITLLLVQLLWWWWLLKSSQHVMIFGSSTACCAPQGSKCSEQKADLASDSGV
jgi:hypothetical protein